MKPAVDIGAQLPSLTVGPISLETVTQFSLVQRDFNPIHVSAAAAQAAGFSGPIVHGMFIFGQFERLIRSWQAMDIVSLQGRFLRPVSVGAVLMLSGRVLQKQAMHCLCGFSRRMTKAHLLQPVRQSFASHRLDGRSADLQQDCRKGCKRACNDPRIHDVQQSALNR